MKKLIPLFSAGVIVFALAGLSVSARQQPAAKPDPAGPMAVAVRVYDGNQFVPDLALQDFEVFENGVPRPVEGLYLVDKNAVERREAGLDHQPDLARRFYLLFQLFEYHPKLAEGIRYLFDHELQPGDSLEVQTPMHNYKLSAEAFAEKPKDVLAEEMTGFVKKDIAQGSLAYNSLLNDLKRLVRSIGGSNPMSGLETDAETDNFTMELLLPRYKEILTKMETLRRIDIDKFILFARALKNQPGRKFVFFIYQREFRPEISPAVIQRIMGLYQDAPHLMNGVQDLFLAYTRNISQNTQKTQESFADSSAQFNLIFMHKAPEQMASIVMREQSEDIFKAFSAVAKATGGVVETSQNPAAGMKAALDSSERYYLLQFSPLSVGPQGTFRNLKIQVKRGDFTVAHRQGYYY